jgi:hypothetical protein
VKGKKDKATKPGAKALQNAAKKKAKKLSEQLKSITDSLS